MVSVVCVRRESGSAVIVLRVRVPSYLVAICCGFAELEYIRRGTMPSTKSNLISFLSILLVCKLLAREARFELC